MHKGKGCSGSQSRQQTRDLRLSGTDYILVRIFHLSGKCLSCSHAAVGACTVFGRFLDVWEARRLVESSKINSFRLILL